MLSCELSGEGAVLDPDRGLYYGVDQVGAAIWRRLERPCTVADLCLAICEEFRVEATECEADVLEFTQALLEAELIYVASETN